MMAHARRLLSSLWLETKDPTAGKASPWLTTVPLGWLKYRSVPWHSTHTGSTRLRRKRDLRVSCRLSLRATHGKHARGCGSHQQRGCECDDDAIRVPSKLSDEATDGKGEHASDEEPGFLHWRWRFAGQLGLRPRPKSCSCVGEIASEVRRTQGHAAELPAQKVLNTLRKRPKHEAHKGVACQHMNDGTSDHCNNATHHRRGDTSHKDGLAVAFHVANHRSTTQVHRQVASEPEAIGSPIAAPMRQVARMVRDGCAQLEECQRVDHARRQRQQRVHEEHAAVVTALLQGHGGGRRHLTLPM